MGITASRLSKPTNPSTPQREKSRRLSGALPWSLAIPLGSTSPMRPPGVAGQRQLVAVMGFGPLKQQVALKVFPANGQERERWEERLQRDTNVWAALSHPNLVGVQRAGWWDGATYVAFEFIPQGIGILRGMLKLPVL